MSRYVFKLPDLGEGAVDAEIVGWRVGPGDRVAEDDPLLEVMTEKATMEVPSPVSGRVVEVYGEPGEHLAVGSDLAVLETEPESVPQAGPVPTRASDERQSPQPITAAEGRPSPVPDQSSARPAPSARSSGPVLAAPATRRRAEQAGIDLASVAGSGPDGRVLRGDLEARITAGSAGMSRSADARPLPTDSIEEIEVKGVRRIIAERLSESARTIPHFTYVEEVDVTELERLRAHLNARRGAADSLTYLPFLILALVRTLAEHPECNAVYDAKRGRIVRHRAVHVGVATQTSQGLKVPVVRDAGRHSLEALAQEIHRVSAAARNHSASPAELTGSTITVTSLGKMGGLASTPIVNAPELAIVGVNRALERPVARDGAVVIRRMMNLSSSFDHRFIDGYDAAAMIHTLKVYLEHPATIFID